MACGLEPSTLWRVCCRSKPDHSGAKLRLGELDVHMCLQRAGVFSMVAGTKKPRMGRALERRGRQLPSWRCGSASSERVLATKVCPDFQRSRRAAKVLTEISIIRFKVDSSRLVKDGALPCRRPDRALKQTTMHRRPLLCGKTISLIWLLSLPSRGACLLLTHTMETLDHWIMINALCIEHAMRMIQ